MSKKFISDRLIHQENLPETTYQMVWHPFAPKEYTSPHLERQRELEEKMVKQAKEKALFIEKEAYEKGFEQGEKDGQEMGGKRVDTVVQQATHLLKEIEHQRTSLYKTFEKEMLQLVLSICKKILGHEIQTREGVILATLREAARQIVDQHEVTVRLNPIDYEFLNTHSDQWSQIQKGREGIRLIKDTSVTKGGCILETAFGDIDGSIETQFDQIVSLIWKRFMESEQAPGPA